MKFERSSCSPGGGGVERPVAVAPDDGFAVVRRERATDARKVGTRIAISRFPFTGDGVTNALPTGAALPETGWWWNPAESGRGMFIEVQADSQGNLALYSAIYGYESSGAPSWHVATSTLARGAGGWVALSMPLQQCRNGQVLGATGAKAD